MNIAITGCKGFLGSEVFKFLQKENNSFILCDLSPNVEVTENSVNCDYVWGDLRRREVCEQLIQNADVLIHMAQSNNPMLADSDWAGDIEQNLLPTMVLLDVIKHQKKKIHIIFPSSGGTVYAHQQRPLLEDDRCFSESPYGSQKILIENYLSMLVQKSFGVSVNVLRISNPYGILLPLERKQGFIGVALNRIKNNQPIEIFGNPDNVRDYIHISDLCGAIRKAVNYRSGYEVMNISSGAGKSVNEILVIMETLLKRKVECVIHNTPGSERLVPWSVLSNKKAKHILSWEIKVQIEDGIFRMIDENSIR
jgi:UDP-glucose 4-epimerase